MSDLEEDDVPRLAPDVLMHLEAVLQEQQGLDYVDHHLKTTDSNMFNIKENWQLSQFWYDEDTINKLVEITIKAVGTKGKIALISCPSLYKKMNESLDDEGEVTVFEYDPRFSIYGMDFIEYDYKSPLEIPKDKKNYYDIVVADPPFLSDECLTKTAVTIRYLVKNKIILCTGATMKDLAKKLLNLTKTNFEPKHRNNLANEFYCYSNFDINN